MKFCHGNRILGNISGNESLVSSVGGEVKNENITGIKKIDRSQITTVKGYNIKLTFRLSAFRHR